MQKQFSAMFLTVLLLLTAVASAEDHNMSDERKQMIDKQIRSRGIDDPTVLKALQVVPRHRFVPDELAPFAYRDHPLQIGHGQTISQPYIVALMTQSLQPKPTDRVLEIGTGSGYQTAVLAEIVDHVYTVELVQALSDEARTCLTALGYRNVSFRVGDGYEGWPDHAPYDAVIVTAAPASIPTALIDQLAEGGRIVVPVGVGDQQLVVGVKRGGALVKTPIAPVRFVPMVPGNE